MDQKSLGGQGGVKALEGAKTIARRAGQAWASMSQEEKQVGMGFQYAGHSIDIGVQPYYDEYEVTKVQYAKAREKYLRQVSPDVLKAVNQKRKKRGQAPLRRPSQTPRIPTSFLRWGDIAVAGSDVLSLET